MSEGVYVRGWGASLVESLCLRLGAWASVLWGLSLSEGRNAVPAPLCPELPFSWAVRLKNFQDVCSGPVCLGPHGHTLSQHRKS